MDTKPEKTMFVRAMYIMVILAVALSVTTVVYAAPPSPFIGNWQATDVDGSNMTLSIAGRPSGPFQITWTDDYISFCDGEAGIVRGTGWLNEGDSNLLEADLHLECFTTGASLDFHVTFRYHPATNTLSIRYSFGQVTIWHRPDRPQPPPLALNLRVNYGHDWVESFYEGGHMAWITVTDGDGNVKATAEAVTDSSGYFQTRPEDWDPAPPDIQPYDWVYGWTDNGASAQVQIGEITSVIDLEADTIEGTINAPWFFNQANPIEVDVDCHSWGAPLPEEILKYDMVQPNGEDTYSCSWAGEWDIQPGQTVGVGYSGPDGHWVANAFNAPNPRIVASEAGDWLWTVEFYPGILDLFIYESEYEGEGVNLLWSGHPEADQWGFAFVGKDAHGQELVPGNYLVVSDGTNQKGLVLQPISVTFFDTSLDFMAGFAPQGSEIWAAAGPQDWQQRIMVEADSLTGAWLADFTTVGFDITEDMQPWSYVHLYDGDGDANEGSVPPLELWAAVFTYDYGTWATGGHSYYFDNAYTFPVSGGGEPTPEISFTVPSDAPFPPLYDGYVMLRPFALRARVDGECPAIDPMLHPDQMTRFVYGWVTDYPMTYDEALAHFDSMTVTAHWDEGQSAELERHEIIPFGSVDWAQYVCTFTAPFILQADAGWVDSGFAVTADVPISITASGMAITADLSQYPGAISGPDGQDWNLGCGQYEGAPPPCAMNDALYGALVGKIGVDGEPFVIGSNFTFTPTASGDLYLTVNDNLAYYFDNDGYYLIFVQ